MRFEPDDSGRYPSVSEYLGSFEKSEINDRCTATLEATALVWLYVQREIFRIITPAAWGEGYYEWTDANKLEDLGKLTDSLMVFDWLLREQAANFLGGDGKDEHTNAFIQELIDEQAEKHHQIRYLKRDFELSMRQP